MEKFTLILAFIFCLFISCSAYSSSLLEKSLHQINQSQKKSFLNNSPELSESAALQKQAYHDGVVQRINKLFKSNQPHIADNSRYGRSLKFSMLINQDGSLRSLEILKSSGSKVFDTSIINTLVSAQPFLSFPSALATELEYIEIIQTAAFHRNNAY